MPRRLPPPHPRGAPRTPVRSKEGHGEPEDVELRVLMGALAGDIDYQHKLREDFRRRRLHPSTEVRIWEYAIGRPKEQIEMSANVTTNERLAAEREAPAPGAFGMAGLSHGAAATRLGVSVASIKRWRRVQA